MKRFAFALTALSLLAACGVQGDLARPDPLWNSEDAIRQECERQRQANETLDPRCARYESGVGQ
ncbi:MAG: hypothetical protein K2P58_15325 [Hyphomonadaceae bacterium]|nr:hypothetical protein [Hyphomonadaceae bacterium]